jgi:hypothetical protein
MTPVGFEPTISASERQETHAVDRAATAIGHLRTISRKAFSVQYGTINTDSTFILLPACIKLGPSDKSSAVSKLLANIFV